MMNATVRASPGNGGGDRDDPPAREVERDLPRRRERVVEEVREVPFIEREVLPEQR
jgi:hypothetical protein